MASGEPEATTAHLLLPPATLVLSSYQLLREPRALHPPGVGKALPGNLWLVPWSPTPLAPGEAGRGQMG